MSFNELFLLSVKSVILLSFINRLRSLSLFWFIQQILFRRVFCLCFFQLLMFLLSLNSFLSVLFSSVLMRHYLHCLNDCQFSFWFLYLQLICWVLSLMLEMYNLSFHDAEFIQVIQLLWFLLSYLLSDMTFRNMITFFISFIRLRFQLFNSSLSFVKLISYCFCRSF